MSEFSQDADIPKTFALEPAFLVDKTRFLPAVREICPGRSPMKISRIRSQILVLPQEDPLASTPEDPNAARPIVIVRLDTDNGIEGIGVTFYRGAMTASLKRAVDDLGALTIGEDSLRVEAIAAKLRRGRRLRAGRNVHPGARGDRHRS